MMTITALLVKALADRLAESFAEYLHREIRTRYWGYTDEKLSNDELIKIYKGIRPAPGYPACPDHLEKQTLWELMEVEKTYWGELNRKLCYGCCLCFRILFCPSGGQVFWLGKSKKIKY